MKTWRCSTPANVRLDRRHGGGVLCHQTRRELPGLADKGSAFALAGRIRGSARTPNWLWGVESCHYRAGLERRTARRGEVSSPGRPARITPSSSPPRRDGPNVPPGTRTSLYQNPGISFKVAPFAKLTLASIDAADPKQGRPCQPVAVCRRAIRGDSGIPGHRAPPSASNFSAGVGRLLDGGRGTRPGPRRRPTERENEARGYIK